MLSSRWITCLPERGCDSIFYVTHFISLLIIFQSLLSPTTEAIESAFLRNNARMLYEILSSQSSINISLPEPISFSDQLSNQQAYFLFRRIFSSYSTFEFYSEAEPPVITEESHYIFKARWSFKNRKNKNQYVFHIFFYMREESGLSREKRHQSSKKEVPTENWKILEIKAERL
ncbi:MAG: hypothetical protein ACE5L7_01485 [Candidatus Aminicenantales bacterium]